MRLPRLSLVQSVLAVLASLASIAGVLVTIFVTVGLPLFGDGNNEDSERPGDTTEFSITIDSPQEGEKVCPIVTLKGTLRPPDPGGLWIVSQDEGGDYYPESQLSLPPRGIWSTALIFYEAWWGNNASILIIETEVDLDSITGDNGEIKLPEDHITHEKSSFTIIDPRADPQCEIPE